MTLTNKQWKELLRLARFIQPIRKFVSCVEKDNTNPDNEEYTPNGQNLTVDENSSPNAEDGIENTADMPEGTTYERDTEPDTSTSGVIDADIVVTFPDWTTTTVTITITVEAL